MLAIIEYLLQTAALSHSTVSIVPREAMEISPASVACGEALVRPQPPHRTALAQAASTVNSRLISCSAVALTAVCALSWVYAVPTLMHRN